MITKKTKLQDIAMKYPEAVEPLLEIGMHCIGCHMAAFETLEEGAKAHGLSDKEVDELIEKMNKRLKKDAKTNSK